MSTISPNFFALTPDRSQIVHCHNASSALTYSRGLAPNKEPASPRRTLKVRAYVSPTGQYYVMHGNQRMDVANASTARHYVKNGVAVETMLEASLSLLNQ